MASKKGGEKPQSGALSENGGKADKGPKPVKKITPATVLTEKVAKLAPKNADADDVELFTIFGVGNGTKSGHTTYGDWTALTGIFEAVRKADGARFKSSTCFVPGAAGEMLVSGLRVAREKDPEASIHFAIKISARYLERRDGTDGYEYIAEEIVDIEKGDPLADLRAKALAYDG